uniref:Uncharacterized protein n=3 Tax=Oryza sativa subsp. japonica TaxID=39947 RepID=Q6H411_ORYSJ|nr:hypothetical protein [Oryza sativa Japonica Group]
MQIACTTGAIFFTTFQLSLSPLFFYSHRRKALSLSSIFFPHQRNRGCRATEPAGGARRQRQIEGGTWRERRRSRAALAATAPAANRERCAKLSLSLLFLSLSFFLCLSSAQERPREREPTAGLGSAASTRRRHVARVTKAAVGGHGESRVGVVAWRLGDAWLGPGRRLGATEVDAARWRSEHWATVGRSPGASRQAGVGRGRRWLIEARRIRRRWRWEGRIWRPLPLPRRPQIPSPLRPPRA